MSIGLIGAHRTGKTTLAREVAQRVGIPFVETSTTKIFQSLGLDPAMPMDFDTRMKVQWAILKHYEEIYREQPKFFITDRTPIDLLGYTYGDILGMTAANNDELDRYKSECYRIGSVHFTRFIIVQPGIPLVDAPGKAAMNKAYIEHLNNLMIGFAYHPDQFVWRGVMARDAIQMERRVAAVVHVLDQYKHQHTQGD